MMSPTLELRSDVSFDLGDDWTELPARAQALGDAGWQAWRAAIRKGKGGTPSFDWMTGLVPPEVQVLSEAYLRKELAAAEKERKKSKRREDPTRAFPLNEVADSLRAAEKIAPLKVIGHARNATLVFAFVLAEPGADRVRAVLDRIVRWSGMRVDGGGGGGDVSLVGDAYGTMEWGLGTVEIRAYGDAGIVVFAAAPDYPALEAAFTRLHVAKAARAESSWRAVSPEGRRSKPGVKMQALVAALRKATLPVDFVVPVRGTLTDAIHLSATIRKKHETWSMQGHELTSAEEVVGYLQALAETAITLDLPTARLQIYEGEGDHLTLHTAWSSAIAETFPTSELAETAGTIACTTDWGFSIAPPTMQMTKVTGRVPIGAVVLDKVRAGHEVTTQYYAASKTGLERLADKAAATTILSRMFVEGARASGEMPAHSTRGKSFKNGNVEIIFEPTRYDRFPVRLTDAVAGGPPAALLARLRPSRGAAASKPVANETWISEAAKSNRSTCRTCGEVIEKGTLRRGEPHDYQGSISYRWHHDACVGGNDGRAPR
jgi:hypothetical protein